MTEPTQVRRPWRTTIRTVFQFVLALATLLPFIAAGVYNDPDQAPAIVGQVLGAAAILTRLMATQQVEAFLDHWFPWLAAEPTRTTTRIIRRGDAGQVATNLVLAIALGLVLGWLLIRGLQLLF